MQPLLRVPLRPSPSGVLFLSSPHSLAHLRVVAWRQPPAEVCPAGDRHVGEDRQQLRLWLRQGEAIGGEGDETGVRPPGRAPQQGVQEGGHICNFHLIDF